MNSLSVFILVYCVSLVVFQINYELKRKTKK